MLSGRLGGVQTGDFGEAAFARASSSINSFSCFNISFFSSFFFGLILTCNFFFFFRAFLTLIVHADSAIVCRHIANQTLYTNFNCLCCGLNHSHFFYSLVCIQYKDTKEPTLLLPYWMQTEEQTTREAWKQGYLCCSFVQWTLMGHTEYTVQSSVGRSRLPTYQI